MHAQRLPATAAPEPQAQPERRSASPALRALSPDAVIALQQSAGNAAVGRALARVPAPPATAPATGSGTDWLHVWDALIFTEDGRPTLQTLRLLGELTRVMPVAGGLTGLAADAIATAEDLFGPTWQYEAPITHVLLGSRGVLNAFNNGLGHLNYVSQLTQDLLGLGNGFTAGPLTMGVNEGLALSKMLVDTVQAGLDTTITTMALLAEQSGRQAAELEGMLARLEEALARSESLEELFETLIEQSLAAAGITVDVELDDLRAAWNDAGRWIDELLADFQSRRDGGPALPVDEAGIRNGPQLADGGLTGPRSPLRDAVAQQHES